MSHPKRIIDRPDEDIIRIVREDFFASEYDRRERNERNFQNYRVFHCRDILSQKQLESTRDNMVGGRFPSFNLSPIQYNKAYLPWARGAVLTSVARLCHGLWPDFNDFYRFDPDDPDDEQAAAIAFALSKYFVRGSRYKQEAMLSTLQAHLFDFGILYTGWMSEMRLFPKIRPHEIELKDYRTGQYHGTGAIDPEKTEVVLEEEERSGWDCASINTMNFRVDPLAGHSGFGEFCGLTGLIPKSVMWDNVEREDWDRSAVEEIDSDEPPNDGGHEDGTEDFDKRLREDEKLAGFDMDGYIDKRYVRWDVAYYPYGSGICKVVVLNKRVVAYKGETWRIPFFKQVFIQNFGMFGGTPMIEPLVPIQHDINQCLRLLRTQQDRAVNPDSVVDPTFFNGVDEAEIQPWGTGATIVATANTQGRDPQLARRFIFHPSGTAPDLWTSMQLQMQIGEQGAGISKSDQGAAVGGATATEIARVSSATDVRGAFIEVFAEDSVVIQPIGDLLNLMYANVREKIAVEIKGKAGMEWKPVSTHEAVMKASPKIIALGQSSMSSREIAAQAVRDVTLAFLANPITAQHLKVVPGMKKIYRTHDVDPDELVEDNSMDRVSIPAKYIPFLLASGRNVPLNPWDDHAEVISEIVKFRQSSEWANVPDENKQLILNHVKLRKQALTMSPGGGMGAPSLPNQGGGGGMGGGPQGPQPMQPQAAPSVAIPGGSRGGQQAQPFAEEEVAA